MGNSASGQKRERPRVGNAAGATATSARAVEIQVHKIDGERLTASVIPGQTTGQDIGVQLNLGGQAGEWFLASASGEKLGMTQDTSTVTQKMINESAGGKWSLLRVGLQVNILAGPEKGNVQNYNPDQPTALIISGDCLEANLIPQLIRKGANMGEHIDYHMAQSPGQGNFMDAHKIRMYNDITWRGDCNIVCVAVANFPHPRAYSSALMMSSPSVGKTSKSTLASTA